MLLNCVFMLKLHYYTLQILMLLCKFHLLCFEGQSEVSWPVVRSQWSGRGRRPSSHLGPPWLLGAKGWVLEADPGRMLVCMVESGWEINIFPPNTYIDWTSLLYFILLRSKFHMRSRPWISTYIDNASVHVHGWESSSFILERGWSDCCTLIGYKLGF